MRLIPPAASNLHLKGRCTELPQHTAKSDAFSENIIFLDFATDYATVHLIECCFLRNHHFILERQMTISANPAKPHLTQLPRKERLFEDFFANMVSTTERLERLFGLMGVQDQIFGRPVSLYDQDLIEAKGKLRTSRSWILVSEMYDYAVDGVSRAGTKDSLSDAEDSLVIAAGEVIALLTGEESRPDAEWHQIVKMADGRFALADGMSLDVERLALLANVDVRTVRNAISSGALPADDGRISCSEARAWLLGRKGFKPTVYAHEDGWALPEVGSAEQFGALLRRCRIRRAQQVRTDAEALRDPLAAEQLLDSYPGITQEMLREVEAGVFRLPLNLVTPLADFYGLPREEFLVCVMRVFFPEQLSVLAGRNQARGSEDR